MRFSKKQCQQCPFRQTALPGWLGNYSPAEVCSSIWKGQPFFCHTSIDYEDPDWERKAMAKGKLCTGSLVFAKRMMAPAGEIADARLRQARRDVLPIEGEIDCMGPREFLEHHTNIEASFDKLDKLGIRPAPMEIEMTFEPSSECPSFDSSQETFEFTNKILGSNAWTVLEKLLGESYLMELAEASEEDSQDDEDSDPLYDPGTVSLNQLMWIANQPWNVYGQHASEIFLAIKKLGKGALVPHEVLVRAEKERSF
jgi:hypothetical protein